METKNTTDTNVVAEKDPAVLAEVHTANDTVCWDRANGEIDMLTYRSCRLIPKTRATAPRHWKGQYYDANSCKKNLSNLLLVI